MSENIIVNRYAKALFRVVDNDTQKANAFNPFLESVSSLFAIEQVEDVLKSPVMPSDLKFELVKHALDKAGNPTKELVDFYKNLVDSRRVEVSAGLAKSFKKYSK